MRWFVLLALALSSEASAKTGTVIVSAAGAKGEPRPELSRAVASVLLANGTSVALMGEGARCDPPCQRIRVEMDVDGGVNVQAELGALHASRHLEHIDGASTVELARAIALEGQDLLSQLEALPRPAPRRAPVRAPLVAAAPVVAVNASVDPTAHDELRQTEAISVQPVPIEPVSVERSSLPPAPAPTRTAVRQVEAAAPAPASRSWLSFGARGLVNSFPSEHLLTAGAALGARAELAPGLDLRLSLAATAPKIDDTGPLRIRLRTTSGSALLSAQVGRLPLWIGAGTELVFLSVDRPVPEFDTSEAQSVGGLLGVEARFRLARTTAVLGVQGAWHPFGSRAQIDEKTSFTYPAIRASALAGLEIDVF